MRKSLLKTPRSALSSRVAVLPSALLADAGGRRRAAKANGNLRRNGSASTVAPLGATADVSAARMRLLEGFLSRTETADVVQYALQWFSQTLNISKALCLIRRSHEQTVVSAGSQG